jgi:hypothetical protein
MVLVPTASTGLAAAKIQTAARLIFPAPVQKISMLGNMSSQLNITLSQDEVLLLFEALAKLGDKACLDVLSEEERSAVWRIEGLCEKSADTIFDPNYREGLDRAKAMARKKGLLFALTEEERTFVHNALNEVCYGVNIPDAAFQTRLGCDRATLVSLLQRI